MKRWLGFFFLYFLGNFAFAALSAQVDATKIQRGETFRLVITLDGSSTQVLPDLTPLQRDFSIVSTERSMSYSMINGKTDSQMQWVVFLSPKNTGRLTIPGIKIGQEMTSPLTVEVAEEQTTKEKNSTTPAIDNEVFLQAEITKNPIYINQQILYTVKLYNRQQFLDAEYRPPQVNNALLIPLGQGRRFQTYVDGKGFNVEEQLYAIFPQKSGKLEIKAPEFHALVYDTLPKRIKIKADDIQVNVKAIPASYTNNYWLPVQDLKLSEQFSTAEQSLEKGTTVVRTITLEGIGTPAQLLPKLTFPKNQQYSVYPEKPELRNEIRDNNLVGVATLKVTYLLNHSGQAAIPELQIPWFNIRTGKEEQASLPSHSFTIKGEAAQLPSEVETVNQSTPKPSPPSDFSFSLAWSLVIIFAGAWLVTFILWRFKPSFKKSSSRQEKQSLKKACLENNPARARVAVLNWANAQRPEKSFINLNEVAAWVQNAQIKKQLHELSKILYSRNENKKWNGIELWKSIDAYRPKKYKTKGLSNLPPINPI